MRRIAVCSLCCAIERLRCIAFSKGEQYRYAVHAGPCEVRRARDLNGCACAGFLPESCCVDRRSSLCFAWRCGVAMESMQESSALGPLPPKLVEMWMVQGIFSGRCSKIATPDFAEFSQAVFCVADILFALFRAFLVREMRLHDHYQPVARESMPRCHPETVLDAKCSDWLSRTYVP